MHRIVCNLLRGCLLLVLLGLSGTGLAQTAPAPPPGGFVPRQVMELERPPLPSGGLVPFRRGAYWGYADTTGRVWVEPVLDSEPPFFVGNVVALYGFFLPQFRDPNSRDTFNGRDEPLTKTGYGSYTFWLNAHGEFLAVDGQDKEPEAALVLPNGHVRAGRAAEHVGAPALTRTYGPEQFQIRAVPPRPTPWGRPQLPPVYPRSAKHPRAKVSPLNAGRFAYMPVTYRRKWVERNAVGFRKDRQGHRHTTYQYRFFVRQAQSTLTALADSTGRRLTQPIYSYINRFQQGWAVATDTRRYRVPIGPTWLSRPGYVLLSRQGRQVNLPDSAHWVTAVEQGTVLLWTARRVLIGNSHESARSRGGIVDTSGRVLLPLTGHLSDPDELGLLRHTMLEGGDSVTRFINRRAEPALGGRVFRRAGPFYNGRAWVEALDGRQGLINSQGQWMTAPYELVGLYPARLQGRQRGFEYWHSDPQPKRSGWTYENGYTPDTAYILCRRAGKYGFLSRHTGQEVIPARYDSVRYHLTDNLACLFRDGQPYVVNARGRELARGEFRGDWYDYPGRPLQLYHPAEGRWSVVDTSGRVRLPWLPGTGYLTPDGRGVVREPRLPKQPGLDWRQQEQPCSGVVDSLGRVVLTFRELAGYSGPLPALHMVSRTGRDEYWPLLDGVKGAGARCYVSSADSGRQYLLRARDLRPLLPEAFSAAHPPECEHCPDGIRALPGGWHVGRRVRDGRSVLISPDGRQYVAPPGTGWQREYRPSIDDSPGVPFARGVEKVRWGSGSFGPQERLEQGYVTLGGRLLWEK